MKGCSESTRQTTDQTSPISFVPPYPFAPSDLAFSVSLSTFVKLGVHRRITACKIRDGAQIVSLVHLVILDTAERVCPLFQFERSVHALSEMSDILKRTLSNAVPLFLLTSHALTSPPWTFELPCSLIIQPSSKPHRTAIYFLSEPEVIYVVFTGRRWLSLECYGMCYKAIPAPLCALLIESVSNASRPKRT